MLAFSLYTSEPLLCLVIKRLLLDPDEMVSTVVNTWLLREGKSFLQYLSCVSMEGTEADGLFMWLASKACAEHVN